MSRKRFGAVVGVVGVLSLFVVSAQAAPPPRDPISWTPTSVELTVVRGSTASTTASFTSAKKLTNVVIAATGGVVAFVTPSPASLGSVAAATPVSVNLAVSVPAVTVPGDYAGAVQVVSGKKEVATSLPVTIHVVPAPGHIYWANGPIGRADLDGSNQNSQFISIVDTGNAIGVAVNAQHIYWTSPNSGTIGRANLDGSNPNPNFIDIPEVGLAPPQPIGIAVDAQHIYWADPDVPAIGRANLDGSDVQASFIPLSVLGLGSLPYGVAINATHIYWADQAWQGVSIGRANLDGTNANQSFMTGLGGLGTTGVAVDSQHLYWGNNPDQFSGTIGRANLDGSNANPVFITQNRPMVGLAVDASFVYWANLNSIGRASLDGSNPNPTFTGVGTNPYFVALGN